jgi:hypothetical protein
VVTLQCARDHYIFLSLDKARHGVIAQEETMEHEKDRNVTETRLLGKNETANYLGMTTRSVDRLVGKGVLMPVRIPGVHRILFDRTDLDRLIDSTKGDGQGSAA